MHILSSDADTDGRRLLSELPPTHSQLRFAAWIAGLLVAALLVTLPLAQISLPRTAPALPAYATAIVINDCLTAGLLLALCSVQRSVAVLVLACGYLLVGLLAVPWALTFPGVFADGGLLGAGPQTTASIAAVRRIGFPLIVLAYAILKEYGPQGGPISRCGYPTMVAGVSAVAALALVATVIIIAYDDGMPALMADRMNASGLWTYVATISIVLYVAAMLVLAGRCRSVLDLWLIVVLFALLIELVLLSFISSGRLSVGWWVGRACGLAAASVVLILMLWETTTLHARLISSVAAESWEREARLTSLEALSASIAHEVNQPLASMVTNADAGLLWVDRAVPDIEEVKASLGRIVSEGHRAGKVIESIRTLFRKDARGHVRLDLNETFADVLPDIRRDARLRGVRVQVDLADDLPYLWGNGLQLQQVLSNLAANAIEAMANVPETQRELLIRTQHCGSHDVKLSVCDTGIGLNAGEAERLFDPFVTTKPAGLGMGLMICRSIVENHGGSIAAAGHVPAGSVFMVILPGEQSAKS